MTPLEKALIEAIKADGPMPLDAWMEACNAYYYATRDPFGRDGDFTTAPEISQMYGEMVGAALADAWARAGRPRGVRYAELGPGRGTLAADALRVMRGAGCEPVTVELVETSPLLREKQAGAVPGAVFHDGIEGLAARGGPILLVASEFFDALPVIQTIAGYPRRIEWIGGHFAFDRDGEIVETSPARSDAMAALALLLQANGGAGIIVDYGHGEAEARGETLQALKGHRFANPLQSPGQQDLTAHVDFAALAEAARGEGLAVSRLVSQGSWLEALGIGARAVALAAKNPQRTEEIAAARRRLCDEEAMGRLFKVMGLAGGGWPMVAGLE